MDKIKEEILESFFVKAVHEPAYRPEFLEQLMSANVYCVGSSAEVNAQDGVSTHLLESGASLQLKSWEDETYDCVIPFFTSLEKMRLAMDQEEPFICLPTKALFEMTLGARLVLNPQSPDATKDFIPDEIQYLLQGEFSTPVENYEVEEDTQVLIGQPNEYPQFMIEQLIILFGSQPSVKAAYLAQIFNQARDTQPTLLIGLDLEEGLSEKFIQELHSKIGRVTYDSLPEKQAVDLIHLQQDSSEGVVDYLVNETKAFYLRNNGKKKGLFARLFS